MFPNATMMQPSTWRDILSAMIGVREAHGWDPANVGAGFSRPRSA